MRIKVDLNDDQQTETKIVDLDQYIKPAPARETDDPLVYISEDKNFGFIKGYPDFSLGKFTY